MQSDEAMGDVNCVAHQGPPAVVGLWQGQIGTVLKIVAVWTLSGTSRHYKGTRDEIRDCFSLGMKWLAVLVCIACNLEE